MAAVTDLATVLDRPYRAPPKVDRYSQGGVARFAASLPWAAIRMPPWGVRIRKLLNCNHDEPYSDARRRGSGGGIFVFSTGFRFSVKVSDKFAKKEKMGCSGHGWGGEAKDFQ
jgi:hypothetical protein